MVLGIGIDSIEIERFAHWHTYKLKTLLKLFTNNEINYCLSFEKKTAERFAGHFAAKEATYKALSNLAIKPITFITFCQIIEIDHLENGAPVIIMHHNKNYTVELLKTIKIFTSITHNKLAATAITMIVSKK